jgi:hypothetical protein
MVKSACAKHALGQRSGDALLTRQVSDDGRSSRSEIEFELTRHPGASEPAEGKRQFSNRRRAGIIPCD